MSEGRYRRGVGVLLLNRDNKVFVGARIDNTDEAWQMPQGGINTRGVVVRSIGPGSPADDMGLRVGDLILNLNGKDTADAATFAKAADGRPNGWRVVLQRGGRIIRAEVSG